MSKMQEFIHSAPGSFLGNGDTERNKTDNLCLGYKQGELRLSTWVRKQGRGI